MKSWNYRPKRKRKGFHSGALQLVKVEGDVRGGKHHGWYSQVYGKFSRKLKSQPLSITLCPLAKWLLMFNYPTQTLSITSVLPTSSAEINFPISLFCPGSANSENARRPRTKVILQLAVEVVCLWSPNWRELEAGRSETQGHSQLLREVKVSLDQLRLCLRKDRKWGGRKEEMEGKEEKG